MKGDFRVRDWLVQPQIATIARGDETAHLEPKVMEVLVYLALHTDDVLPKERIIQAVWGDTFVTDEVLTNPIAGLRRAFGDDSKDPHTIHTLPRRGYRIKKHKTEMNVPVDQKAESAHGPQLHLQLGSWQTVQGS